MWVPAFVLTFLIHNVIGFHILVTQNDTNRHNSNLMQMQTIITLSKLITPQALHQCLKFIYSGAIDMECTNLKVKLVKSIKFEFILHGAKKACHINCYVSHKTYSESALIAYVCVWICRDSRQSVVCIREGTGHDNYRQFTTNLREIFTVSTALAATHP